MRTITLENGKKVQISDEEYCVKCDGCYCGTNPNY